MDKIQKRATLHDKHLGHIEIDQEIKYEHIKQLNT